MSHVFRAAAATAVAAGLVTGAAGPSAAAPVNGRIVFVGQDAEAGTWGGVFSMASDGSDVVRLTADTEVATDPEYSPDGRRIAYSANHDAYANLYTMAADGSDVRRLTETPFSDGGDLDPTWTPDGLGIVFVSTRGQDAADYGGFDLYRVDADGTDEQRLTVTARDVDDTQPAVSPDGTRIAFVSDRPVPEYGFTDLFVMDIDGSNVQRLTFDAEPDGASFGHYADSPVWSPDGTRIAFSSDRSGNKDIWTVDADGTDLTNLTADPSEDLDPAWSPDGSTLTWTSSRSEQYDLWSMPVPTAATVPERRTTLTARTLVAPTAVADPVNLTASEGTTAAQADWQQRLLCTVVGTPGDDVLTGTSRADVICGRGGNDVLRGYGGDDELRGGAGRDVLVGGAGSDNALGHYGSDTFRLRDTVVGNDQADGGWGLDLCRRDTEDLAFHCP